MCAHLRTSGQGVLSGTNRSLEGGVSVSACAFMHGLGT